MERMRSDSRASFSRLGRSSMFAFLASFLVRSLLPRRHVTKRNPFYPKTRPTACPMSPGLRIAMVFIGIFLRFLYIDDILTHK